MSGKYDAARDAFGDGALSWLRDPIHAQLVTAAYTFDAHHRDRAAIRAAAIGPAVLLTQKTIKAGWMGAARLVFRQVTPAKNVQPITGVVFLREGTNAHRGVLIYHADQGQPLPINPNGGDIEIDIPAPGLFRL